MGFYGTSEEKFKDKWAIVSTSAHNLSMLYKLNRHLKPSNSWKFWKPYKETLWGVGRRIGESRNPFKWGKSQKKCKDHLHKVESRDFLRFQSRLFFFFKFTLLFVGSAIAQLGFLTRTFTLPTVWGLFSGFRRLTVDMVLMVSLIFFKEEWTFLAEPIFPRLYTQSRSIWRLRSLLWRTQG